MGLVQISGSEIFKKTLQAQEKYLMNVATFPIFNTTVQEMSILREELEKKRSIVRIIKTKNTIENGRWLVETTKQQYENAKKDYDEVCDGYNKEEGTHFSRINPTLDNDEMHQISLSFTNQYKDVPLESSNNKKPTKVNNPVMISYNLNDNIEKTQQLNNLHGNLLTKK